MLSAAALVLAFGPATARGAPADTRSAQADLPTVSVDCMAEGIDAVRYTRLAANIPVNETVLVSPTQVPILGARPGDVCTTDIRVENRRSKRTTFDLLAIGVIGSSGRGGAPSAEFLEPDDPRGAGTAQPWIGLPLSEITLGPRNVAIVPVTVRVPTDPADGGHYAAVAVRARQAGQQPAGKQVRVESQLAVTVLVDIEGTTRRELEIASMGAPGVVYAREPLDLSVRIRNQGNSFATPGGSARIESMFGKRVTEFPVTGARLLLPGGTGTSEARWKQTPWFGRYELTLRVRPLEGGAGDSQTVVFWAIPPWWVFAVVAAALLLVARRRWRGQNRAGQDVDEPDDQLPGDQNMG